MTLFNLLLDEGGIAIGVAFVAFFAGGMIIDLGPYNAKWIGRALLGLGAVAVLAALVLFVSSPIVAYTNH